MISLTSKKTYLSYPERPTLSGVKVISYQTKFSMVLTGAGI